MSFYNRSNGLGASAAKAAAAKPTVTSVNPEARQALVKELAQKYEMPDGKIVKGRLQADIYAENMLAEQAKKQDAKDNAQHTMNTVARQAVEIPWWNQSALGTHVSLALNFVSNWMLVAGGVAVVGGGVWWLKKKKAASVAGYRRRRRSRR